MFARAVTRAGPGAWAGAGVPRAFRVGEGGRAGLASLREKPAGDDKNQRIRRRKALAWRVFCPSDLNLP